MSAQLMERLGQVASQRWGLLTTSQAEAVGVGRLQLSRLAQAGALERVQRGVYRMAGAPEQQLESIYADWLALGGADFAPGQVPPVVAGGQTAAIAHGLGDFFPGRADFIVPMRRGTRLPGVRLRTRAIGPADVTFVDGLPALTVQATIVDLIGQWTDLSLVAGVISDAIDQHKLIDTAALGQAIDGEAARMHEDPQAIRHELGVLSAGNLQEG